MKIRWRNALILMLVCAVMGAGVAASYSVAAPRIAQQAEDVAIKSRQELFPRADSFSPVEINGQTCYIAYENNNIIGYIAQGKVKGYQGEIELRAGMNLQGCLTGISVGGSSFSETPGLGARVREDDFTAQFVGLAPPLELWQDVDAVGGATISSRSVVNGINQLGELLLALQSSYPNEDIERQR